jgi:hypothetical protein
MLIADDKKTAPREARGKGKRRCDSPPVSAEVDGVGIGEWGE